MCDTEQTFDCLRERKFSKSNVVLVDEKQLLRHTLLPAADNLRSCAIGLRFKRGYTVAMTMRHRCS